MKPNEYAVTYTIHFADIYDFSDKFLCRVVTLQNEKATVNNLRCAPELLYSCGRIVADDGRILKNRWGDISPPL